MDISTSQSSAAARMTKGMVLNWARLVKVIRRTLAYVALILVVFSLAFPLLWMILGSLKSEQEIYLYPPTFWPQEITFQAYIDLLNTTSFGLWFRNSVLVSVVGGAVGHGGVRPHPLSLSLFRGIFASCAFCVHGALDSDGNSDFPNCRLAQARQFAPIVVPGL